jgi:dynein heavy chain 1
LIAEWNGVKPIQADVKPTEALSIVSDFDKKMQSLHTSWDMISRAKDALNIISPSNPLLLPALEELNDLKGVWQALQVIWTSLDELKDLNWTSVMPRKVRQRLDQLVVDAKNLPNNMRQYASFEYLSDMLKELVQLNILITELKSEAMRERHWRQIFKRFNSPVLTIADLSLGDVWNFDLKKNESFMREVIQKAQGEMALELFLEQVRVSRIVMNHVSNTFQGSRHMVKLSIGACQLPKQVPYRERMGRNFYKVWRSLEQFACHEIFSTLQGV